MPIRKIPKNYRNLTGVVASSKSVGSAQFESTLERDFLSLLEFAPDVLRFEVQPLKLEWRDRLGALRSYTPDVLVEFIPEVDRMPWLCEVKYRADLKKHWPDLHPKFRQGVRHANRTGWRFRLITEVEVRTPFLTNVRFLAPFRHRAIPQTMAQRVMDKLQEERQTSISNFMQLLASDGQRQAEWLPVLWHLMAHHRIAADLDMALTMDSQVWCAP